MSTDSIAAIRPWRMIERRKSRQIMVGNVPVGGDAPISVQTMTNTLTSRRRGDDRPDPPLRGCGRRHRARILPRRRNRPPRSSRSSRAADVPIVADIHFHYKRALEAADAGAACLRINPGNIGSGERVAEVVRAAKANGCAIRIGVNAGSLEKDLLEKYGEPCPEALVECALDHIKLLQDHDFHEYKVAVKASDVFLAVAAYQGLADAVDCPLHLGITEAGGLIGGTVKSAHRHRQSAVGGDRRHDPRFALGRAGRGSARRVRDPEGAGPADPRRARRVLPQSARGRAST